MAAEGLGAGVVGHGDRDRRGPEVELRRGQRERGLQQIGEMQVQLGAAQALGEQPAERRLGPVLEAGPGAELGDEIARNVVRAAS